MSLGSEPRPEIDGDVQETEFSAHPPSNDTNGLANVDDSEDDNTPLIYHENSGEHPSGYGSIPVRANPPGPTFLPVSKNSSQPRAVAPDLLRGLLMVFQAIDHCSVILGAWEHGLALASEGDGTVVHEWNEPVAWTARMLTHTCAPGFTFLLGMGVVYLCRSRSKLGWSAARIAGHFVLRAIALALVNQVFVTLLAGRANFWMINMVLIALAVDYLLAGMICLAVMYSEKLLSTLFSVILRTNEETTELGESLGERAPLVQPKARRFSISPASISWHIHNCILMALVVVTIGWNHWLALDQGRCSDARSQVEALSTQVSNKGNFFFDFWFYPVQTETVMSAFPPLAWLSFAILGVLYGRILIARSWTPRAINMGNVLAGCLCFLAFVSMRLLHFGNLSEGCLQMPEQKAHPSRNQYLASFRSFFYIVKYPPSAAFFSLTMTLNFLLLAFFGSLPTRVATRIPGLLVFGTSALFFYVVHFLVYVLLAIPVKHWFGHKLGRPDFMTGKPAVGTGDSPAFWATYLVGLLILYPCCLWYGRFKSSKGPNSIWRFF